MDNALRDNGQMAVELCAVMPVVLVVLVLAVDLLMYAGACSRFDHAAAQLVLAHGVTTEGTELDTAAQASVAAQELQKAMEGAGTEVKVSADEQAGLVTYTCTMRMSSWVLARGGSMVLGMEVPRLLKHEYVLVVRTYVPGQLL